ncbi:glycosyltransferase family 4 protein [Candidatus Bathycorpusculum sp.]|uniref:glycosyltransferase family 4 protein n=1 Tax=Candidatus Bathycorpusculum sp. TaxID=2994959 RepID=UPI00281A7691|nr:glycosyltransferase family 4 protein [Candidatus Termitimicrobium sp.]
MLNKKLRISLISDLVLDVDLHKAREIEILSALAERGHITTLVAVISKKFSPIGNRGVTLISVPIKRIPMVSRIIYAIFLFFFIPFHVLIKKPDLVIMDPDLSVISSIPTLLISRLLKTKFILDVKSTPVEIKGISAKLAEFWFNVSVLIAKNLFHGIAVLTIMMRAEVSRKFNLNKKDVAVWTSGVPIDLFNPHMVEESGKLRKQLGLEHKFIVFYHGVFSASRGLFETITAMEKISQKYPDIVFFLLGAGTITSSLSESVQKLHLEQNVVIHTPVPYEAVPQYIGFSDVCIVPLPNNSYWNFQSPLKLLEYLAMQKVVLASDIYAHRAVIADKLCGIYIPSVNPLAIAKTIDLAYNNRDKLAQWGIAGRGIVEGNYTWRKVAQDVEESIYKLSRK